MAPQNPVLIIQAPAVPCEVFDNSLLDKRLFFAPLQLRVFEDGNMFPSFVSLGELSPRVCSKIVNTANTSPLYLRDKMAAPASQT